MDTTLNIAGELGCGRLSNYEHVAAGMTDREASYFMKRVNTCRRCFGQGNVGYSEAMRRRIPCDCVEKALLEIIAGREKEQAEFVIGEKYHLGTYAGIRFNVLLRQRFHVFESSLITLDGQPKTTLVEVGDGYQLKGDGS